MSKKEIDFILTIDNGKFSRAIDKSTAKVSKMARRIAKELKPASSAFLSLGKNIGFAGAAATTAAVAGGLYALNSVVKDSIALAIVQEEAEAKLAGVLRATGEAAGFTIIELKEMASGLQEVTTVGDEVALSAMSILATFKEIKGDAFRDATKAAIDMSAVLGQDLNSSVLQIGKALNDPIKGMTALSRAGVSFTEEQKQQVKVLQQSGRMYEAQQIILKELASEFGGVAEALRGTFKGAVTSAGNAFGDLKEEIGFTITKNKFFIDSIGLIEAKFVGLGSYIKANRSEVMEWGKQGALAALNFAEASLAAGDYLYRGFSGVQGLFQATAASALYVSGGIFKIIESAAKLTDMLHLTNDAAQDWGVDSRAAFDAADAVFAKAGQNFEDMANGSGKLQFVSEQIAKMRGELEKIEAVEMDPAAELEKSAKEAAGAYEFELKNINGVWVNVARKIDDRNEKTADVVRSAWSQTANQLESDYDKAISATMAKLERMQAAASRATEVSNGGRGFRWGGHLPGYGGGDRIPALLEAGEFIFRKEAVSRFGVGMLDMMNSLRLPKLPDFVGFNAGGLAGGGPAEGGEVTVNLAFPGGESVPSRMTMADARDLDRLTKRYQSLSSR